jgi:uncharacterized Zn-binding protein involved in type VI secretion
MSGEKVGVTRFLALLLLALATPALAAPRSFPVISFDRIKMEAPFDVVVATGKSPSAKAEGPVAALDIVDLRVEGRTLIIRQRSGSNRLGKDVPVRISLATPGLRGATLLGTGRLAIDRMSGPAINLVLAGPGQLQVADLRTDRLELLAAGSGTMTLAGAIKTGRMAAEGGSILDAAALFSDELVVIATGNAEVRASARRSVSLIASGAATVKLQGSVACIQRVTGAATVSGCR